MFKEGDTVKIKSTNSWDNYKEFGGLKSFVRLKKWSSSNDYTTLLFHSKESEILAKRFYRNHPIIGVYDDDSFITCKLLLLENKQVCRI